MGKLIGFYLAILCVMLPLSASALSPKILAFSGSTREESLNKKLLRLTVNELRTNGANVTVIDLRDYPLPFYDGDLETKNGVPENAMKIKKLMIENDGFLIASPEYNGSYSAVLKNVIDWISRPVDGEPSLVAFKGKKAGLLAASPGGGGGEGSLKHLRELLTRLKVDVFSDQITLPNAHKVFTSTGSLKDQKQENQIKNFSKSYVQFLQ